VPLEPVHQVLTGALSHPHVSRGITLGERID
jgi:hypothetical protein